MDNKLTLLSSPEIFLDINNDQGVEDNSKGKNLKQKGGQKEGKEVTSKN